MAKMVPNLSETTLNRLAGERATRAEVKVFRALRDALPDACLVRYRVPWLSLTGDPVEGEADFVVFDPQHGVLTVEVKGGGVEFDPTSGDWTSTDRDGDTLSYSWNFGDGTSGTGATVTHTYNAVGTYTATLTTYDGRGGVGSATVVLTVTP